MKYDLLLVSVGGILGSVFRFLLGQHLNNSHFPYGTLLVNLTGSLFLGFLLGYCTSKYWNLFLGVGFSGAFTTFSTLNKDLFLLIQRKETMKAMFYLGISLIMGFLFFFIGYYLGTLLRNHNWI